VSDDFVGFEPTETEVGPDDSDAFAGFGDAEPEVEQPDETAEVEPERQYIQVDDPDNRYVRTVIDGEEVDVPFSEFQKGYSRHADYTRKTQDLAQQRQQAEFGLKLQQALAANPQATLQLLAQQHGMSLAEARAAQEAETPEFTDPVEAMVYEERQARIALEQRLQQRDEDAMVESAVNTLRTTYRATDDDINAVIQTAYQLNLPIAAVSTALPMIYQAQAFQRLQARAAALQAQEQAKAAKTAERTAAKQAAMASVSPDRGTLGRNTAPSADSTMSLDEAIAAAFAAHDG
jgi:hypothetical protein